MLRCRLRRGRREPSMTHAQQPLHGHGGDRRGRKASSRTDTTGQARRRMRVEGRATGCSSEASAREARGGCGRGQSAGAAVVEQATERRSSLAKRFRGNRSCAHAA